MKKICVVTAARSEYGLLKWLIHEINQNKEFKLQILVTGSHLSKEFGYTYKSLEEDNFTIDEKIDMLLSSETKTGIAKSMGILAYNIPESLERLHPDLVIYLGDRYELLPIANACLIMDIPTAHISGGDVTEGAIDDQVRNAITTLSTYHFTGNPESNSNVVKLLQGKGKNVFEVGEPGLDNFKRLNLISREELSKKFELPISQKWFLLTYHQETKLSLDENLERLQNILNVAINCSDDIFIFTKANADFGGIQINRELARVSKKYEHIFLFDNLGQLNYLSMMKEAYCLVGNTSSGIVEAPYLGKPVINIGKRQLGRYFHSNITTISGFSEKELIAALQKLKKEKQKFSLSTYYGEGGTSIKIIEILKKILND